MRVLALLALVLLLVACLTRVESVDEGSARGLSVYLDADWANHPLVAQVSELIGEQSDEKYWSFMDAVVAHPLDAREDVQMAHFASLPEFSELDKNGLLSLRLALHSAAPKCQMFQQHASTILNQYFAAAPTSKPALLSSWFAVIPRAQAPYNVPIFSVSTLKEAIAQLNVESKSEEANEWEAASLVFPFDHRRTSSPNAKYQVIVHANYAARDFEEVYQTMVAQVTRNAVPSPSSAVPRPENDLEFVLRPFYMEAWRSEVNGSREGMREEATSLLAGQLQGFGVELAVKNVEYRVLDKASVGVTTEAVEASADGTLERLTEANVLSEDGEPHEKVKAVLKKQFPAKSEVLESLSSQWWEIGASGVSAVSSLLRKRSAEEQEANPVFDELGVQTMQLIYDAAEEEVLAVLRDVAQNLPSLVPLVAQVDVSEKSYEELQQLYTHLGGGGDPGAQAMQPLLLLNGESIDIDSIDPFRLLTTIGEEVSKHDQLKAIGCAASSAVCTQRNASSFASHESSASSSSSHYDASSSSSASPPCGCAFSDQEIHDYLTASLQTPIVPKIDLMWDDIVLVLNDLETHPNYARWPRKVRELLKPSWPGQLLPIAKNFFTITFVLDPRASSVGVRLLDQLTRIIIQNQLPIRIAFHVLTHRPERYETQWQEACANTRAQDCEVNWVWAKMLTASHHSIPRFINLMQQAATDPTNLEVLKEAWEMSVSDGTSDESWSDMLAANSDAIARQASHLASAGFSKLKEGSDYNLALFNGRLLKVDPDEPLAAFASQIQSIKQSFQQDVYLGKIGDDTDIYKYALGDASEVYQGYHQKIFSQADSQSSSSSSSSSVQQQNGFVNLVGMNTLEAVGSDYLMAKNAAPFLKKVTHYVMGCADQDVACEAAVANLLVQWLYALDGASEGGAAAASAPTDDSPALLFASRLALLPSPRATQATPSTFFQIVDFLTTYALRPSLSSSQRERAYTLLLHYLESVAERNNVQEAFCNLDGGNDDVCDAFAHTQAHPTHWHLKLALAQSLTKHAGEHPLHIVTNGRIIGLDVEEAQEWDEVSWRMLTRYEYNSRAHVAATMMQHQFLARVESREPFGGGVWSFDEVDINPADAPQQDSSTKQMSSNAYRNALVRSDMLLKIVSLMNGFPKAKKVSSDAMPNVSRFGRLVRSKPLIALSGSSESVERTSAAVEVTLVVDPLSQQAQTLAPILSMFMEKVPMTLRLVLIPRMGLKELPLKNYFRFVVSPNLRFQPSDGRVLAAGAHFDYLPKDVVLTLNVMANSQWMVASTKAPMDLDNILLANAPERRAIARYQLENILVEGSCSDMSSGGNPPRGLQLTLGNASNPHLEDTLVMSNLGYFQLKANPGVWYLSLAEGKGSKIYTMLPPSRHSESTSSNPKSILVSISAFSSDRLSLKVAKLPGMEKRTLEDDLDDEEDGDDGGVLSSLFSSFSGGGSSKKKKQQHSEDEKDEENENTIHVFSVASGHLYERFMRIMMLSVKQRAPEGVKVKFWIIKNFLSPEFKKSVEYLGKEFGFEVSLVQYQWPKWLRGQSEKQRKIWGYKILFLDVLFPLSLKKVIYIDSDQVVRTNLMELMDMDLHGAPYGFTPFCEGVGRKRQETSGFRFWDSGFWKDHLRGRPYHISALFVVDLQRFRKFGFADQLRATYDQLSRDPNSLANLDQDLPNYMQHHVPIFSLPPEWLWCETWCSDETKADAKTIDLCNNPLTKQPKLDNALRVLPEWPTLDNITSSSFNAFKLAHLQATTRQSAKPQPPHAQTSPQTNSILQQEEENAKDEL